jgi:cytochrome P450
MNDTETGPVVFDPHSIEFFDDPFPIYERLRDEAPTYHNERHGFYALSRDRDVYDASANWQAFSSAHGSNLINLRNPDFQPRHIINIDPPQHDRLRALVNRAFSPRGVARMEHVVREVIAEFIAPLEGRSSFDMVEEFSALFPNEIISAVLGIPIEDRANVRQWTDDILFREEGADGFSERSIQAYASSYAYFLDLVQFKRQHPADDTISHLIEAEMDDGEGGTTRLTDQEVADFAWVLGAAGTETVTKLVGNATVLLHRHRDQRQLLIDDPGRIPAGVPHHRRREPRPSCLPRAGPLRHHPHRSPGASRVGSWPALLHRRRPRPHREPVRDRGDPQGLARVRTGRAGPAPGAHGERRWLQQRPRHRLSGHQSTAGASAPRPAAALN